MYAFMKRYSGFFLLAVGIIGLVVLNVLTISKEPEGVITTTSTSGSTQQPSSALPDYVFVDVKGEVRYPAVYQVRSGSRVEEVVLLAGGVTDNADLSEINLAKVVYDQMVVYIPGVETVSIAQPVLEFVYVDLKGAVRFPGVYKVPSNFRVYDAIMRAGGFDTNADSTEINLSTSVSDQMVIIVPYKTLPSADTDKIVNHIYVEVKGEVVKPGLYYVDSSWLVKDVVNLAGGLKTTADIAKVNLNQGIVKNMQIIIPAYSAQTDDPDQDTSDPQETYKININTATIDELDTLKGIGYVIAQRIIDYRAEYGNFESIEDIMLVSGIKQSVYDEIKDSIKV